MSAASFSGREPRDVGVGAVANDQRHPTGGKGHRRRRQEDERQPRGREDSRERHPFTLIAQSSVWSAKLHLQQVQTSVTDKANGRSPEESQEALLSAANTVKCVGEGPGRCRASRPGGGEHGRRERDLKATTRLDPPEPGRCRPRRPHPRRARRPAWAITSDVRPGPEPGRGNGETRAGAEVVLDGTADCGAAHPHPGEAGLRRRGVARRVRSCVSIGSRRGACRRSRFTDCRGSP